MKDTKIKNLHEKINNLEKEIHQIKKHISFTRQTPNSDCFDIKQVSNIIGCSTESVKNYVQQGKLKMKFPNAKKAFHPRDVEYYLRGMKAPRKKS